MIMLMVTIFFFKNYIKYVDSLGDDFIISQK